MLPSRSDQAMTRLCSRLMEAVHSQLEVQLVCGIDGKAPNIHVACLQANRAWRYADHSARGIVSYDSLHAELILDHISKDKKIDYLRRIFPGCSQSQIREFISLLDAWFAADGSLNTAAQNLYIHKNTLQYRLKRLAEVSGLDVRRPSQAPALYLAVQFFQELDSDRNGLAT